MLNYKPLHHKHFTLWCGLFSSPKHKVDFSVKLGVPSELQSTVLANIVRLRQVP